MELKIKNTMRFGYALVCFTMFLSCEKEILNQLPKDSLTDESVWTDSQGAIQFLNAIYGGMPSGFDRNYQGWGKGLYLLDGVTDDGDVCMPWTHSNELQNGEFLPSNVPWGETWGDYYNLIRKANIAIENLGALNDESLRQRLLGEAHFLRGFMYHELLRLYGIKSDGNELTGVPILENSLTLDDNFEIPRSSYDEVVDFIITDLNKAASLLPSKGNIEAGRATVGAANALSSRVLLYAERFQDAAIAAEKVIDTEYYLFEDYRTLFLIKNNEEIIYAKKFQEPDKVHFGVNNGYDVINTPRSFRGASDAGWGGNVPTQNFVDSYEMVDGKAQDVSPMYDETKPYENLDPRFEATVVHNGSAFRGRVMEFYPGGTDVTNQPEDTKTGYQLRKFHEEQYPIYTKSSDQDWIFIRYAEVLLNYAEAKNEASGPDQSIINALIRSRSFIFCFGIIQKYFSIPNKYPILITTLGINGILFFMKFPQLVTCFGILRLVGYICTTWIKFHYSPAKSRSVMNNGCLKPWI